MFDKDVDRSKILSLLRVYRQSEVNAQLSIFSVYIIKKTILIK